MNKTLKFCGVIVSLASIVLVSSVLLSCSTVAITGRQQLNIMPDSSMLSMSFQQYSDFMKSNKMSTDQQHTRMVKAVGTNIQKGVEDYFRQRNMQGELKNYAWEFNLFENKEANAWCMPGGKVAVYTGILPVTIDENGLAVVMGHEIAHAIAKHGNERFSQGMLAELGTVVLAEALKSKPDKTKQLWMTSFGLGAQVGVLLPFSRLQENEADRLGLIFMSMAGYDPNGAVQFWERMEKEKSKKAPPEFLSTHPSDQTRIQNIKKDIPEAMRYYKKPASIAR